MRMIAIAAGMVKRVYLKHRPPVAIEQADAPAVTFESLTGIGAAILCALVDEKTEADTGCVEQSCGIIAYRRPNGR